MNTTAEKIAPHVARNGLTFDVEGIARGYIRRHKRDGSRPTVLKCLACDHPAVGIDADANETDVRLLAELMVHADTAHGPHGDIIVQRTVNAMFLS